MSFLRIVPALLVLGACAPGEIETTEAPGSSGEATSTSTTSATGDDTSGAAETSTGEGGSESGATTGEAPTTSGATTGAPFGEYCQGFDAAAPARFLELFDFQGEPLGEGATFPLECGGQGAWMFGLYPKLGGWDPQADVVTFTLTVDVDGFNSNPAGHFFSGEVAYYIGCDPVIGGVIGVAPVLPPDDLADLAALDGLPASVRVEVDAGGEALVFDAGMTLSAPAALVAEGCFGKG